MKINDDYDNLISRVKSLFVLYLVSLLCFMVLATAAYMLTFLLSFEKTTINNELANLLRAEKSVDVQLNSISQNISVLGSDREASNFLSDSFSDEYSRQKGLVALQNELITFENYSDIVDTAAIYCPKTGSVISNKTFVKLEESSLADIIGSYDGESGTWRVADSVSDKEGEYIYLLKTIPTYSDTVPDGLAVVTLKDRHILDTLDDYFYTDDDADNLYVINGDNRIIVSDTPSNLGQTFPYEFFADGAERGTKNIRYNGKKYVALYIRSEYSGWGYVNLKPRSQIYRVRNMNLLIIFVIMLIVLLLGIAVLRRIDKYNRDRMNKYLVSLENKLKTNISDAKEYGLFDILNGVPLDEEKISDYRLLFNVKETDDSYMACVIRLTDKKGVTDEIMENVVGLIELSISGYARELSSDTIVCIFSFNSADGAPYKCTVEYLEVMLKYEFKRSYVIGIGGVRNDFSSIYKSYNQAIDDIRLPKPILSANRKWENSKNSVFDEMIRSILLYVDENINNSDLSLGMLSEKFKLNSSYLSKIFKKEVGESFIEYITSRRIENAKNLLENTSLKVNEISEKIGYDNYVSFLRAFKKYTGENPGDFRKRKSM